MKITLIAAIAAWLAIDTALARGQAQRAIAKAQAQARATCRSLT